MSKASPFEPVNRRLSVYGYLAPLVDGARVLEIGTGEGAGAAHLMKLGATAVVGADADAKALSRARSTHREAGLSFQPLERRALEASTPGGSGFDLIVIPDAAALLRASSGLTVAAARGLLSGPQGRLVLLVGSADRPGAGAGAGFYEVTEALERLFPRVRMFGVTPFAAFGVAEFSEATSGLRIDGGLLDEAAEQPTHYLALAGPDDGVELGYALVQIPVDIADGAGRPAVTPEVVDSADASDLRRRLAEAEGKAEGVLRVSRAQAEEIEELRARLRRAGEARAELDQEVDRLRRALAEADESVLDLTRRTREEMAALASRITAGLRPGDGAGEDAAGPAGRLREEIRRREEELAARESALSERDERVAGLEADRQDLRWQLDAEGEPIEPARLGPGPAALPVAEPSAPGRTDVGPYRLAAAAHLQEVNRLREALAEQSSLVAELEDALAAKDARLTTVEAELVALRRHTSEVEQADRARRSRLAEVEGTLLRLQRQAALAASQARETAPTNGAGSPGSAELERSHQALAAQVRTLEARLRDADQARTQLEQRYGDAVERLAGMERALAEQAERSLDAAPAPDAADAVDMPRLEVALREVSRLREALERSEEQLWETKGQLLLDRERMTVLEHELSNAAAAPPLASEPTITEAAHQSIMKTVLTELGELESSIRQELDRLDSVERMIDGWRADLAVDADAPFTGPNG